MFPVCIQYFTVSSGATTKLLDFIELNDERSSKLADMLTTSITNNGLDLANASAYSADNANVNGCRKSVFTTLNDLNNKLIEAHCNARVLPQCYA